MNPLLSDPSFWAGILITILIICVAALLVYLFSRLAVRHELDDRGLYGHSERDHRKP